MLLLNTDLTAMVDWSRAQFALTAMYHWLFVPLTLGLSFIIAFMETRYVRTGDSTWRDATKFWMTLFGINFAIGVATGLILEFEFGTNWSNYSYFVGDIFGAPLAIEGIMAFFMESTFIAVMFFGWNKVSRGFHLTSTWLTAVGANLSALWILVANAWMQSPVGMEFNPATARNEMVDFWAVLFSPVAMNKFFHTVTSAFVLSSVFVIGVSAYLLLRKRQQLLARRSIRIASVFGLISTLFVIWTGDGSGVQVARVQPMKLAAMEGLYQGRTNAPLTVIGVLKPAPEGPSVKGESPFYFEWGVPSLLSAMSYRSADSFVAGVDDLVYGNPEQGILSASERMDRGRHAIATFAAYKAAQSDAKQAAKDGNAALQTELSARADSLAALFSDPAFKRDYFAHFGYGYLSSERDIVPNVPLVFYAFRVMVGLGLWFMLLFIVMWNLSARDTLERRRWILHAAMWSIPLVYIASQAGWIVAEVGRQPWTIQNLLPTVASVSKTPAASVEVTFWIFAVLFTTLLVAEIGIMVRQIRKAADKPEQETK